MRTNETANNQAQNNKKRYGLRVTRAFPPPLAISRATPSALNKNLQFQYTLPIQKMILLNKSKQTGHLLPSSVISVIKTSLEMCLD